MMHISKYRQHLAAPSLEVIDEAIRLIESDRERYCCWAFDRATFDAESGPAWAIAQMYKDQFKRFCTTQSQGMPSWWSEATTTRRKAARILALRAFRQACIDAAK